MSKIAIICLTILCPFAVIVLWLIRRSPEGREDKEGFHLGSAGDPQEKPADKGLGEKREKLPGSKTNAA